MDVAELVPEVALRQAPPRRTPRAAAGPPSPRAWRRCDASGSCQPVRSPSTERTGRSGDTTVSVQPSLGCTCPCSSTTDSSARTTVVPTATTRPPGAPGVVDPTSRGQRDPEVLGVGGLAGLQRGDPGVQQDRCHADPLGDQPGQHLGRERPPGARHLGRARARWRRRSGRRRSGSCRARSRSGWAVRGGPGSCAGARASRPATPTAGRRSRRDRGSRAPSSADPAAAGQVDVARPRRRRGGPARRGGPPRSTGPRAARSRGAPGRRPVGRRAVELGGQGPRGVDDDQVALVEEAGQLGEVGVHERPVRPGGHQHAHRVAGHAPALGRRRRLELGRQGEGERAQLGEARRHALRGRRQGAHATARSVSTSAAR